MSADDAHIPDETQARAGSADTTPPTGSTGPGPLLRAVAVQRPPSELLQLVDLLNSGDQCTHAQEVLDTAAELRPVEEVAVLVPLLGGTQAATALHAAAARRPVAELAELVGLLNSGDQFSYACEILDTAAALRTVEDVAVMVPLLADPRAATALHAAAARRPVEEAAPELGGRAVSPGGAPPRPRRRSWWR
ncbi:hypothetical protein GXW82_04680 [Streptacidiphilus sp. 4-A2]|nr:hypothetical protein [Streptacidiphilus sp. 4-A2]